MQGAQPLRAAAMGAAAVGGQSKNQQGCPDAFLTTATAAMGIISSTKGAAAPILTTAPNAIAQESARGFGFGFYTARDPLVAPAPPGPIRRARTE